MTLVSTKDRIRISYTPTLVKKAKKSAVRHGMLLSKDAESLLQNFLEGTVGSSELSDYKSDGIKEDLLEKVIVVPLKAEYALAWGSGRKRKKRRMVKKRASRIVKNLVSQSCKLQYVVSNDKSELESETLATAIDVVLCGVWPICEVQ